MNTRPVLALLCATVLASGFGGVALAATDQRLATRLYNPDEVVRIDGRAGVQAAITFDEGEQIENVAVGDSNAWQITPNKRANALFVKPLAKTGRTNMTVITDRHTYYFDLVASPQAQPLYVLRFAYPEKSSARPAPSVAPLTGEEAALAAGTTPTDPAALNFGWNRKGKASLLPARVYDDGSSVFVSWMAGAPVPAILIKDASGAEGPVNYAVRGDVIVIEGVPSQIVLRQGKDVATLDRTTPVAAPANTGARQAFAQAAKPQGN
jgi:type IV secretion system protein VirB9